MTGQDLDSLDAFHKFVLIAVIDLRSREDTPVHSFDVSGVCEDLLDEFERLDEMLPGGVTRQRVISALGDLEDAGHLGKETTESATGKGRPAYALSVDETGVLDSLAGDDRFADAVDHVRERRD